MRPLGVGLLALLTGFLPGGVAHAQRATSPPTDSAAIVALVRSAIQQLPPRDSALRGAPWRVGVADSTSSVLLAAAAGATAAIGVRPRSEQDRVQAVLDLWAYTARANVRRLSFSVTTIGRCGQTWDSVYAYHTSYEVVARRISGRWVTSAPTEVGHGDPTTCYRHPGFDRDRTVRPSPTDSARPPTPPAV